MKDFRLTIKEVIDIVSNFKVDVVQVRRKNSFEAGRAIGAIVKNHDVLQLLETMTRPQIDTEEMEKMFSSVAPHLIDEMKGIAEELQIPYSRATALFSGYDVPKLKALGCTALMTDRYYVRNYDFSPEFYDGLFVLHQSRQALATAGYSLQVLGRHDGVNEKGLTAGLHFVSLEGYRPGVSSWTAVRMVLDCCSTVDDAVQLLKEIPHVACYNFSLADEKGNLAVVEASPEQITVHQDPSFLSCVNHFRDPSMQKKNRPMIEGSLKRENILSDIKKQPLSPEKAFHLFKDQSSPFFFTDYDELFGTLHTFMYVFDQAAIYTAVAQSKDVLKMNFQEWVLGKDTGIQSMTGQIQSEEE